MKQKKIRYAVVGLGNISQVALLPSFKHTQNSELVAFVSSDSEKLGVLGRRYQVKHLYSYDEYDELLESGLIDAVYIGLPNDMHSEYALKSIKAGVHVLCEKPLAITTNECVAILDAAEKYDVKVMVAYRLHFERANLEAIELAKSGKLGDLRFFNSIFSINVKDKSNIRLQRRHGGGPVFDLGVYCINASRYLFQSEPTEVFAYTASREGDKRFDEVEEMASVVLRFPEHRLATFTTSFGSTPTGAYDLVGTRGQVRMDPAYEYAEGLSQSVIINEKRRVKKFSKSDQFGPELIYFSNCILNNEDPEPNAREGLIDVHIIECILQSAREKRPIGINARGKHKRPSLQQQIRRSGISRVRQIHSKSASDA